MGKVYASADWHGCWFAAEKILNYLQSDDSLIFLGDACDRGPDGIRIFQTLIHDPRVTFVKGNHEQIMQIFLPSVMREIEDPNLYFDKYDWVKNGGEPTIKTLMNMSIKDIKEIQTAIEKMPNQIIYPSPAGHTVILEHAGYSPFIMPSRSHDPLWDREHFFDSWDGNFKKGDCHNTYLVHGHTPVQYLEYFYGYYGNPELTIERAELKRKWLYDEPMPKPEILRYCNEHKFDIDLCTITSGRAALLDLDTFETIYFDKEENKEMKK